MISFLYVRGLSILLSNFLKRSLIQVIDMIKSYMLFTTPFCKFCPTVKEYMLSVKLPGTNLDATKEGSEKAVVNKVHKVPTVIFLDNSGKEVSRAHTISEIRNVLSDY